MSDKHRFEEIKEQIKELLDEAFDLVPEGMTRERAESYWYAHIAMALDNDHGFIGGSMCSMQDTLEEFDEVEEEDDEEEDWDPDSGRPAHMRDEDWN